jgi:hypothetical protein
VRGGIMRECHFNMECAMWLAQLVFSLLVIVFCMLMIGLKQGALEVYLPLITSTAAVWVPNPKTPSFKPRETESDAKST